MESGASERVGEPTRAADVNVASELEQATANRAMTVGLAGMSVAILTFALIFLYDRSQSGVFDPVLFRVTLADLVASVFVLAFAGAAFYWQMDALRRKPSEAARYARWAGRSFLLGIGTTLVAPGLILLTARLLDVGALAVGLWLVLAVMLYRMRPEGL